MVRGSTFYIRALYDQEKTKEEGLKFFSGTLLMFKIISSFSQLTSKFVFEMFVLCTHILYPQGNILHVLDKRKEANDGWWLACLVGRSGQDIKCGLIPSRQR